MKHFDTAGACVYLDEEHGIKRKPSTLAGYRKKGTGPEYYRDGQIPTYTDQTLDKWVAELRGKTFKSTAEVRAASS